MNAFWVFMSFYFWIWAAIIIYIGVLFAAYKLRDTQLSPLALLAIQKLAWYPLNVIICWGPSCIYDSSSIVRENNAPFKIIAFVSALLIGLFDAMAFFYSSSAARECAMAFIFKMERRDVFLLSGSNVPFDDEDDEFLSSIYIFRNTEVSSNNSIILRKTNSLHVRDPSDFRKSLMDP